MEENVDTLWRGLADGVVGVHYTYMGYLVVGGFLAWRWPKTIWVHVAAVLWAVVVVVTKVACPLTALQNHFRESAGQRPLPDSFINIYIKGTFYPADRQTISQIALGILVIASWIGFVRWQRRSRPAAKSVAAGVR